MQGLWQQGLVGAIGRGSSKMKKRFPFLADLEATRAIESARTSDQVTDHPSQEVDSRSLWIDGVGGFQLIGRDEAIIGQAASGSRADIRIVGDLGRQAAAIRRSNGDYLVQPLQETRLNGALIDRPCLLPSRADLVLGNRVRIAFCIPHPLSATARLELNSVHRFHPRVDAVLLMAQSCVLGPSPQSHVLCRNWSREIVLFRAASGYSMRAGEGVWVNGKAVSGIVRLTGPTRVEGDDFSFSFE
ncbi:MAG: hypothetical protein D6753_00535 [Planctomycetota bacterium]|nr:MAG: hypothetical protein D6753_00535 [Planctomycetota bacterium]